MFVQQLATDQRNTANMKHVTLFLLLELLYITTPKLINITASLVIFIKNSSSPPPFHQMALSGYQLIFNSV